MAGDKGTTNYIVRGVPSTVQPTCSSGPTLSWDSTNNYWCHRYYSGGESFPITISATGYTSVVVDNYTSVDSYNWIDVTLVEPVTLYIANLSDGTNTYTIKDPTAREMLSGKQDTLVSGTNIKTINNISILGSGNIAFPTIDSALNTTSTNAAQNKVITSALKGKLDGYNLNVAGQWTGGVHPVNFVTFNYSECNSENGIFIKLSMVNSHGNGITGRFYQDVILNCNYTGIVAGTLYRYFGADIDISTSEYYGVHKFGDIFWTIDTTNKIVKFYVLMRQYSYTYMTPYFRLNASTKGVITQHTGVGAGEYSSGTQSWATINNFEDISKKQDIITSNNKLSASLVSGLATVATSGNYNDLSNKPTIPTVNNATLTITQGGTTKGTFTANALNDVTIALDSGGGGSSYTAGTGIDITNNEISVDGVQTSELSIDTTPTQNSSNLITSGGVYDVLGDVETLINAL